jgi:endonuclease/exonuclease/phosphatase family metal-dependent hydrolase
VYDEAALEVCSARPALSILTWNIFMMPPWIHESPRNGPRAAAIGAALLEQDFDILCLQKAFDGNAREILAGALGARYPHRYGPANDGCSLKISSGVWVLSRHPLTEAREIQFDACSNVECFSRKGALSLRGVCAGGPFQLIATHLQGEEGARFTPEHQHVRDLQMVQLRDTLMGSLPVILCGDLGTPRFSDDGRGETDSYRQMLATFQASNGDEPRITLDDARTSNDLATGNTGRRNELDYILLRPGGRRASAARTRHVFRRAGWDAPPSARQDLSYRYAVGAVVSF